MLLYKQWPKFEDSRKLCGIYQFNPSFQVWRIAFLADITTMFWDIGGVILTNGWGRASRLEAAKVFNLDWEEFVDRHDLCFPALDAGLITLNAYMDRTLFYRPRAFTREEFTAFMFAQSKEFPDTRESLRKPSSVSRWKFHNVQQKNVFLSMTGP